jgi:hypothetical protein
MEAGHEGCCIANGRMATPHNDVSHFEWRVACFIAKEAGNASSAGAIVSTGAGKVGKKRGVRGEGELGGLLRRRSASTGQKQQSSYEKSHCCHGDRTSSGLIGA